MTQTFTPTHIITLDNGERIEVQLIDGAAYTRAEAESLSTADYECSENGEWTFQGSPFAGTVERFAKRDGLSRCDHCHAVTPHDKLIQVPQDNGTLAYFCSYECAEGL